MEAAEFLAILAFHAMILLIVLQCSEETSEERGKCFGQSVKSEACLTEYVY
jgi:hypothetical protein